jgi:cell division protein FtsI (penicillin-binding protein 3)
MALRYLGVMPKGTEPVKLSELSAIARNGGDQATSAYQVMSEQKAGSAAVVTPSAPLRGGEVRLPDFQGFPIREAIRSAKALGLSPQVEGTGRVTRQEPPAGTVLPKGSAVKLVLEPPA